MMMMLDSTSDEGDDRVGDGVWMDASTSNTPVSDAQLDDEGQNFWEPELGAGTPAPLRLTTE
jgi:hypothetical protein